MGLFSDTIREHPEELLPLLRVHRAAKRATRLPQDPDLAFCYDMLNRVSRSFALVIQQLGPQLRDPVRTPPPPPRSYPALISSWHLLRQVVFTGPRPT